MIFFKKNVLLLFVLSIGLNPIAIHSSEDDSSNQIVKTIICTAMGAVVSIVAMQVTIFALNKFLGNPINSVVNYVRQLSTQNLQCTYVGPIAQEVTDLIECIKNPMPYKHMNVDMTKGILLYGGAGCGKTHLARYIAIESGCPFFSANASDFTQVIIAAGKEAIIKLFQDARAAAQKSSTKTAIIFIDELDAIGSRDNINTRAADNQNISALLTQMDGLEQHKDINIVVIGATNYRDKIDAALLRSGRFDQKIYVSPPTESVRKQLFKKYLQPNVPYQSTVGLWQRFFSFNSIAPTVAQAEVQVNEFLLESLVDLSNGMTPADIKNICNESGRIAIRAKKSQRDEESFVQAFWRIKQEQRERQILSKEDKNRFLMSMQERIRIPSGADLINDCTEPMTKDNIGDIFRITYNYVNKKEQEISCDMIRCASTIVQNKIKRSNALEKIEIAQKIYGVDRDSLDKKWDEEKLLGLTEADIIGECKSLCSA